MLIISDNMSNLDKTILEFENKLTHLEVGFTSGEISQIIELLNIGWGDTILDPFSGAGTLQTIAGLNGVNSISIENDDATFRVLRENLQIVSSRRPDILCKAVKGNAFNIDYTQILSEAGIRKVSRIITSPPFTFYNGGNPSFDLGSYSQYFDKLGSLFARLNAEALQDRGLIAILVGDDYKANGETVDFKDLFIQSMSLYVGFQHPYVIPSYDKRFNKHWLIYPKQFLGESILQQYVTNR